MIGILHDNTRQRNTKHLKANIFDFLEAVSKICSDYFDNKASIKRINVVLGRFSGISFEIPVE